MGGRVPILSLVAILYSKKAAVRMTLVSTLCLVSCIHVLQKTCDDENYGIINSRVASTQRYYSCFVFLIHKRSAPPTRRIVFSSLIFFCCTPTNCNEKKRLDLNSFYWILQVGRGLTYFIAALIQLHRVERIL